MRTRLIIFWRSMRRKRCRSSSAISAIASATSASSPDASTKSCIFGATPISTIGSSGARRYSPTRPSRRSSSKACRTLPSREHDPSPNVLLARVALRSTRDLILRWLRVSGALEGCSSWRSRSSELTRPSRPLRGASGRGSEHAREARAAPPASFGLGDPCGLGATQGASAYFLISAQRVGQVAPRRVARGGIVLVANRLVDRDMLRLNLAQISEAFRVAAAGRIDDLTGNDEIPQKLEKLRKVAIVRATENRQMELKVRVHGVAAGLNLGLDGLQGGLDPREIVACPTLSGEAGGFDLQAHPQFEDLQHVICRLDFVRIDAERPALHVRRHERAKPLAGDHQAVGPERRNCLAHHRPADACGQRDFLFGRQASAWLQASAEDLGGKPLGQLLGPIERRPKR